MRLYGRQDQRGVVPALATEPRTLSPEVPLSLIQKLSLLRYTSVAAVVCICYVAIVILYECAQGLPSPHAPLAPPCPPQPSLLGRYGGE